MSFKLKKKADAILDYGIVLMVALGAVVAMFHEVRRGISGGVKRVVDKLPDEGGIGRQGESLEPKGEANRRVSSNSYRLWKEQEKIMEGSEEESSGWSYNAQQETKEAIDYSRRPLETNTSTEIDYPNAEYWRWEKTTNSYPLQ